MLAIDDRDLPGLADLSQERLRAITGADHVALLGLRYRAGKRAIVHIAFETGEQRTEGALWFFKGDKARRLARHNRATARFAPEARALFEAFPHDHRMPQIRDFLGRGACIIEDLTGTAAAGAPVLLRYRPGLSCTFRCPLEGGSAAFVKLINDDDPARLLKANRIMLRRLAGGPVTLAPALGIDASVSAVAYASASGRPLDAVLAEAVTTAPLDQAIGALRTFWQAPIAPARRMGPDLLLNRARESAAFVAVTAPSCVAAARAVVARLVASPPDVALRPIHGDMKLEHVFIDGSRTVLIDTESVSLGPPDYDLAQLLGRLWQAELEGQLPRAQVRAACARVRAQAGPAFGWCLDVVALRLAKFYARRPASDMTQKIAAMLEGLV